MLSRVAENLYWLGRYLERADNVTRILDVEYHAAVERGDYTGSSEQIWSALVSAVGSDPEEHASRESSAVNYLVLAADNPYSIRSNITNARELARGLREHISREVWEEINELYIRLGNVRHVDEADLFRLCKDVKRRIETVFGLFANTVLFNEGREWFRCGLYIERADMTSRILDTKYYILLPARSEVGDPIDRFQWTAILRSASASEAYRKTFGGSITGPGVADFLILNRSFPRSLAFCVSALTRHFANATTDTPAQRRLPAERLLVTLEVDMRGGLVDEIIRSGLHEYLHGFQQRLLAIDDAMLQQVFRPLPEVRV